MIYTSISLCLGIVFGLISFAFRLCFKEDIIFFDTDFFNEEYMQALAPKQRPVKAPAVRPV